MLEGKIYINRDPVIFRYVILYLRNEGKLPIIEDKFTKALFEKELDFWGLPPDYNSIVTLENIYKEPPRKVSKACFRKWRELGPFDIQNHIQVKNLHFVETHGISADINQTNCDQVKYDYCCQSDSIGYLKGFGRTEMHSGELQEGQFECSKLDGFGRVIHSDGSCYIGEMINGRKDGLGKMIYPDGQIEEGWWHENVIEEANLF